MTYTHYCPVCFKIIPREAYLKDYYICCFQMMELHPDGWTATTWGTIRLGKSPGEFSSIVPKQIFLKQFEKLRHNKERKEWKTKLA